MPGVVSGKGLDPLLGNFFYYLTSKWSILVLYLTDEIRTQLQEESVEKTGKSYQGKSTKGQKIILTKLAQLGFS